MFGHPRGLAVLFFTELWERFSFYGMRAILVLYLVAQTQNGNPGLGWNEYDALTLYGWYTMLVYLMGIPGGIIADRWLSQRKAIMVGGALLCAGHLLMAYINIVAFFVALSLIILGVGLLKPNISTMVGELYPKNDPRRDSGFTIFYMGINIGAFLASLLVGYVGERIGWHYGFMMAGLGMIVGQCVYIWGQKYLGEAGRLTKSKDLKEKVVHPPLTSLEKKRIVVVLISFLIVIVFWGAFEQAGGFLNLYTDQYTNRMLGGFEIPASWFQSLNPFFIVILGPVFVLLWQSLGKKKKDPSAIFKMGLGNVILGLGFALMIGAALECGKENLVKCSMLWITGSYLLQTIGELCLSPVALSFVTKMSPPRAVATMMGLYFAMTGLGDKLAGEIGKVAVTYGALHVFAGIAIFTVVAGLILIALTRSINRLAHDKEVV